MAAISFGSSLSMPDFVLILNVMLSVRESAR